MRTVRCDNFGCVDGYIDGLDECAKCGGTGKIFIFDSLGGQILGWGMFFFELALAWGVIVGVVYVLFKAWQWWHS